MRTFYTAFGLRCVRANQFNAELPECPVELRNPLTCQALCLVDVKNGVTVAVECQRLAVALDVTACRLHVGEG